MRKEEGKQEVHFHLAVWGVFDINTTRSNAACWLSSKKDLLRIIMELRSTEQLTTVLALAISLSIISPTTCHLYFVVLLGGKRSERASFAFDWHVVTYIQNIKLNKESFHKFSQENWTRLQTGLHSAHNTALVDGCC